MAETRLCPICKRPLDDHDDGLRFRPFCSKRCAEVDLGRWLKGAYAIPATETEEEDADVPEGETGDAERAPPIRH
jgi:endogenous inhibitor of DNA gyrase (YacG/DUF329 family)